MKSIKSLFFFFAIIATLLFSARKKDDTHPYPYKITCPCELDKKTYPFGYKGVIIEKYNDRFNHGVQTISVAQGKDTIIFGFTRDFAQDSPFGIPLWNYIIVGDTFIKPKNSYHVEIQRDTTVKIFDVNCPPVR